MSLRDDFEEGYREGVAFGALVLFCFRALNYIAWFMYNLIFMVLWWVAGIVWTVSIVGARFAGSIFKCSILGIRYPYSGWQGVSVILDREAAPVANVVWCCTFGWIFSILYIALGVVFCCSLLLIPSGVQFFKAAKIAIMPFGVDFE